MFYVLWVIGVLLAVMLSAIVTISIETTGKFDE